MITVKSKRYSSDKEKKVYENFVCRFVKLAFEKIAACHKFISLFTIPSDAVGHNGEFFLIDYNIYREGRIQKSKLGIFYHYQVIRPNIFFVWARRNGFVSSTFKF